MSNSTKALEIVLLFTGNKVKAKLRNTTNRFSQNKRHLAPGQNRSQHVYHLRGVYIEMSRGRDVKNLCVSFPLSCIC
jgi:hypothetical protein